MLLWPCVSFFVLSLAYFLGSVHLFGKRESGDRSPISGLLLSAFTLFGRIVWEVQTRLSSEPPWHAVGNSLIVSRRLRPQEFPENVSAVIDLTSEFLDPQAIRSLPGYRCIPMLDANALTPEVLAERVRRIPMPTKGRLLIHCANGYGRAGSSRRHGSSRRVWRPLPDKLSHCCNRSVPESVCAVASARRSKWRAVSWLPASIQSLRPGRPIARMVVRCQPCDRTEEEAATRWIEC